MSFQMIKKIFGLLSVFLFFSCSSEKEKPEYIWDEEEFAEVLTEVQIAESIVRLGYHRKSDSIIPNDSIYSAAFKAANTNRSTFDSNYNYYLDRPDEMERVYELVITNLSQRSALLKQEK